MIKLFGKLFGSDKIVDGLINSADAIWETQEEKSRSKMLFLKLYEPFKLAQRYALMLFTMPFVFVHLSVSVAWLTAIFSIEDERRYKLVVTQIHNLANMNNTTLGEPVLWIVAFYFLGGAGEGIVKAAMTRMKPIVRG